MVVLSVQIQLTVGFMRLTGDGCAVCTDTVTGRRCKFASCSSPWSSPSWALQTDSVSICCMVPKVALTTAVLVTTADFQGAHCT